MLLPKRVPLLFCTGNQLRAGSNPPELLPVAIFWPQKKFEMKSRWWQLKCFFEMFTPNTWKFHDPIWRLGHIFHMGFGEKPPPTNGCRPPPSILENPGCSASFAPSAVTNQLDVSTARWSISAALRATKRECFVARDVDLLDGVLILLMVPKSG